MEKKGLSHIEVIMAFIMFMAAIMVIFYFFDPIRERNTDNYVIEELYKNIIEMTSNESYRYSVIVNNAGNQINVLTISLNKEIPADYYIVVRNLSGDFIPAKIDNSDREKFCFNGAQAGVFVSVIFSPVRTNQASFQGNCNDVDETYFDISSARKEKIASEIRFKEFNDSYYMSYQSLKDNFNIDSISDFDFSLKFDDGFTIEQIKQIPSKTEIGALNKRIEILRENGKIEYADLKIRLWR